MKRLLLVLISIILILPAARSQMFTEQTLKFGRTMALIEAFYVDSTSQEKLTEKAIVEVLKNLDPHSIYISKDELQDVNQRLQGSFEGIGIEFNVLHDTILVISPMPGGPSEKVGLMPGDRIVTIDGENVAGIGISTNGVRDRLLGDKGTKVTVGIYRKGSKGIKNYDIIRDELPVNSLLAAYMLPGNIGYIKLSNFSLTTEEEFNNAVDQLLKEDMEDIVIDLRGNAGGYLEAAIRICDNLFSEERLIVYLEGLNTPRQDFFNREGGNLNDAKVVILVDEGSASASEIVAGAIQEWDRGLVIGRRTFGKGLVQNAFNLGDGSAVRLTIARYYTPTGRLIQRPYDQGIEKYMADFFSRYTNGEMVTADSINLPDSLRFYTKINKRPIYGGGGIMPDVFVPADTSEYSDYYRDLITKNVITQFSLEFADEYREMINRKYDDFESFREEFMLADRDIRNLIELGETMNVKFVEEDFKISENQIKKIVKGLIARDIWDMSEYYQVVNSEDPVIIRAVEAINDNIDYLSYLRN